MIGSGGREHALAWRLSKSPYVKTIYVAPGNAGTLKDKKIKNINLNKISLLVEFAKKEKIYMTIVGPEIPLSNGIVNIFKNNKLKIFGPTKEASMIETSKDFAKSFMVRNNIPTAYYKTFKNFKKAENYIYNKYFPIVIKDNNLSAGKGVMIAKNNNDANNFIKEIGLKNKKLNIENKLIIEDYLEGNEISFISISDGYNIKSFINSKDYKSSLNFNKGMNTGGMGSYAPSKIITPIIYERILKEIILPTIFGMNNENNIYKGFLYAGIILGFGKNDLSRDIKVLEFNCRMGDPETQSIMMLFKSDLMKMIDFAIDEKIDVFNLDWSQDYSLSVIVSCNEYPNNSKTIRTIRIPEYDKNCMIFHSGTNKIKNKIYNKGGRIICITSKGKSLNKARLTNYENINKLNLNFARYRNDIGLEYRFNIIK